MYWTSYHVPCNRFWFHFWYLTTDTFQTSPLSLHLLPHIWADYKTTQMLSPLVLVGSCSVSVSLAPSPNYYKKPKPVSFSHSHKPLLDLLGSFPFKSLIKWVMNFFLSYLIGYVSNHHSWHLNQVWCGSPLLLCRWLNSLFSKQDLWMMTTTKGVFLLLYSGFSACCWVHTLSCAPLCCICWFPQVYVIYLTNWSWKL